MDFKIILPAKVEERLFAYIQETQLEISGLGTARISSNKRALVVTGLYLLKQECTSATTELDQGAVAELMADLVKAGRSPVLNVWWHSHANLDVFWSWTDDDTIRKFTVDYMICLVGNKQRKYKGRLEIRQPFDLSIDTDVLVIRPQNQELRRQVKAEIRSKVTEKVYTPIVGQANDSVAAHQLDTTSDCSGIVKGIMGWMPRRWEKRGDRYVLAESNQQPIDLADSPEASQSRPQGNRKPALDEDGFYGV